ncbi:outer membrane efflux protein [Moorella thermoacetica]|uniref:Outer membrane efflux protein n=1 Tax=Neomoorella thermoacetica TaxID=1525 RepID=A0A1J5JKE2_NEOTH|nr:TolC family protein [Moorella thermoacetica]OIQ09998.1 outer membrane efflux protein [Moorella thermoacetica]
MYKWRTFLIALTLVLGITIPTAQAQSTSPTPTKTLTLQQAVNLALMNDNEVKKAEAEVDSTEAIRDKLEDVVKFTPLMGPIYDLDTDVNWAKFLQADIAYKVSQKNLESKRDSIVLKVCQLYWNVLSKQEQLAIKQKLEQLALINLENARASISAGTLAPAMLTIYEGQWKQAQKDTIVAMKSLDEAFNDFNQTIGLDVNERPILIENPQYKPLEIDNLEYEIERVKEESPLVLEAKDQLQIQKWLINMPYATGQYTPSTAREKALEKAEYDVANVKKAMEQATRNIYYNIKSIEQNYEAAQEALKMAQEKLKIEKSKYNSGMGIKADVVTAEINVAQAQQTINDIVRTHAYLKLAFEKPWAASGSSSTATSSANNS